jgi:hypothetical protein
MFLAGGVFTVVSGALGSALLPTPLAQWLEHQICRPASRSAPVHLAPGRQGRPPALTGAAPCPFIPAG